MFGRKSRKTFCCAGLRELIENAGGAGLSALAKRSGATVVVVLQARGIPYVWEHLLAEEPDTRDRIWKISESTGMKFCPFCGARMARVVSADVERFDELADSHFKFTDDDPNRPALRPKQNYKDR